MEQNKKYSDISYLQFIKDVLKIELTKEQEILLELFEENKNKKVVEYTNNSPFNTYFQDNNIPRPTSVFGTVKDTDLKYINNQLDNNVSEDYSYRQVNTDLIRKNAGSRLKK